MSSSVVCRPSLIFATDELPVGSLEDQQNVPTPTHPHHGAGRRGGSGSLTKGVSSVFIREFV
jgi:hypothetical protein